LTLLHKSQDKQQQNGIIFLLLLFLCGVVFFARNAHLQLAADDIGWLRGEAPTVFDQYRHVPRFFFTSLYALFGPNPIAALTMIFFFHLANSSLVYYLCQKLLNNQIAARVAATVYFVNPITLSTLTWISCFSYVLGTSLALLSLLAFWKGGQESTDKPHLWWSIALACYGAGLFCSHELFFLPVLYFLFGWLQGGVSRQRGSVLFMVAMIFAMPVNFLVYDFGRYGVEAMRLFSPGFASAFASSALSFGLSLGLAYPLSFFVKTVDFLRICFSEPVRWGMTLLLLTGAIFLYKPNRAWRLRLVLALSFSALIMPYIIRLYLTPDSVNYHISYVLSGRVFYLPFTVIALVWGEFVTELYEHHPGGRSLTVLLPFVSLAAYFHALLILYDRTDFMGLEVLHGSSQGFAPPWTPYAYNQPIWLLGSALVIITVVAMRFVIEKLRGIGGTKHEAPSS
jgi:hypothetical protein